jgi:hypothetical protein
MQQGGDEQLLPRKGRLQGDKCQGDGAKGRQRPAPWASAAAATEIKKKAQWPE